jgi:uncharacterized protein YjbI with pentapeptide repeats
MTAILNEETALVVDADFSDQVFPPGAVIRNKVFFRCDFHTTTWIGTTVRDCVFADCVVKCSDFTDCDLTGTHFVRCLLEATGFDAAKITETTFAAAYLFGTTSDNAEMHDYIRRFASPAVDNAAAESKSDSGGPRISQPAES